MRYLPRLIPFCLAFVLITFSFTSNSQVSAANPLILPAGFVDEPVYSGLLAPRAFTFSPDGRVFALDRGGLDDGGNVTHDSNFSSVRVFKNGVMLSTPALTLHTCGDAERGALGIAVDPNFVGNGYIYIYYTRQDTTPPDPACGYNTFTNGNVNGPRNRISRFTMSGDTVVAGSEVVLIDSIVTDVGYHNAGDLHFGLDGYLYASSGEGGLAWTSGDTGTLNGKILRILPTAGAGGGYTTTGNPYDTATGARNCDAPISIGAQGTSPGPCKEIFAKGFRNPFRFNIEPNVAGIPGPGSPMVGDVGGGAWEEINQVHSGGDYGHPVREGYCSGGIPQGANCLPPYQSGGQVAGYDNPIYAYPHLVTGSNFDSAVIGGDFYIGGAGYPVKYVNNYFFTDFARGFIGRLIYSGGQWVRTTDFASGGSGIIGLKRGPDLNLYYLSFTSDTDPVDGIRRIRYIGAANQRPTAQISVDTLSGPLSTTYTFSGAGSTDPENNTPFTYNWDFGDSTTATTTTPTTTHVYSAAQNFATTLTVTDSGSQPATSIPATIVVYPGNTAPSGTIALNDETNPSFSSGFTYYAGDVWDFAAANLSDDHALPANAVTWDIVFHHQQHTHPFIPFVQADHGQFTIPYAGELNPMVWYRVHMFITDDRGERTEVIQDIDPVTKALTFMTNPSSGKVTIEGATFTTPLTITRVVGMHFTVTVPSPQIIWGLSTTFNNWSQGGSQQQVIIVPTADTTYTANFSMPGSAVPIRNDFTTHNPTLTWNRVTWAIRYVVQVADNTTFTNGVAYQAGNNLSITLPTTNDGVYYWRVAPCATPTTCGTWSASDVFVVDAP